jgi:hypothetical protein
VASFRIWHRNTLLAIRSLLCVWLILKQSPQVGPARIDLLPAAPACHSIQVRAAGGTKACTLLTAQHLQRERKNGELPDILPEVDVTRIGGHNLHFRLISVYPRPALRHVDDAIRVRDRFLEIIRTSVTRENTACSQAHLDIQLAARLFKRHFEVNRLGEAAIEADFLGARLQRSLVRTFRQVRDIDSQGTHRSPRDSQRRNSREEGLMVKMLAISADKRVFFKKSVEI